MDHAETVSGKLVDFQKTRFHGSARQSEAESTNEKNGGLSGGSLRLNAGVDPTSDSSRIGRDETCYSM